MVRRHLMVMTPPPTLAMEPLENPYPSQPSTLKTSKHLWAGLVIGILTVILIALLYYLFKMKLISRCRKQRSSSIAEKKRESFKEDMTMLRRFQFEELEKATNNFSRDCLLGFGASGNVYKGTFGVEGTLAIKRAHANSFVSIEDFRNEVRLLSKVKHRNLVGLVGYCEGHGERGRILVYEYVPNGSLLEYIMGRRGRSLTWRQRVHIAIGAAKGIAYLHEGEKPSIIHRDLKPSNILVGDGYEAKVSDFGLVRSGPIGDDQSYVSSQIKGTPGYLDPDYCSSFHLTTYSDVYSFGIILLQLVSARPVVDTARSPRDHIIDWARPSLEKGNIEEIIDANLLCEPCNFDLMLKMGQLGLTCVAKVPKQRPTMTQVWQDLEEALLLAENLNKQSSRGLRNTKSTSRQSREVEPRRFVESQEYSENFVSIDGIGLQKFRVEMDSFSFQSASLRCLENNSISIELDNDN